ncbi:MAG: hypothetical protein IPL27_27740 [Lewinellaceae bacterium]|nr:hypothetical protein [Lewinellaceae bacterium]
MDKKVTMNGVTEQQQGNWNAAEELKGFKDLHINRPAWRDQYLVDSLRGTNGEITGLRYVAVDSTMRIREVEVDWADGAVSEIREGVAVGDVPALPRKFQPGTAC